MAKYEAPIVHADNTAFYDYGVWSRNMRKIQVGLGRTAAWGALGTFVTGLAFAEAANEPIISPQDAQITAGKTCYEQSDAALPEVQIAGDHVFLQAAPRAEWQECVQAEMANYVPEAQQLATREAGADLAGAFFIAAAAIFATSFVGFFPANRRANVLDRIKHGGGRDSSPVYGHIYYQNEIIAREDHFNGKYDLVAKFANHESWSTEYFSEQQIINALLDLDKKHFGKAFKAHWKPEHLDAYVRNRLETINALRTVKANIARSGDAKLIKRYHGFDLFEHPDHKTLRPLVNIPTQITASDNIAALLIHTKGLPPAQTPAISAP
ncbi:MAG: hypothetical protein GC136_00330 [Alphaproteobacteria bacterium]|nr:hypothetical protein [Alphaproteobacteria bacterium]